MDLLMTRVPACELRPFSFNLATFCPPLSNNLAFHISMTQTPVCSLGPPFVTFMKSLVFP